MAASPVVIKVYPPDSLIQDCTVGEYDRTTNGGLAKGLMAYERALVACNADKEALRAWSTDEGL